MIRRLRKRVLPNLATVLTTWQFRRCRCCGKYSFHLQFGVDEEYRKCLLCTANLRYEMQAEYLREHFVPEQLQILELDPNSCLRPFLQRGKHYIRTYYRPDHKVGAVRGDGSIMEDITRLSMPAQSLDLIVSSDVLEHVPDVAAAFSESFRVLRPGGAHIFTVPFEAKTFRRAALQNGQIQHFAPPEYHADPLDPEGILAFWHFGPDLQEHFGQTGLKFELVQGPEGKRRSVVWKASRPIER